MSRVGWAVAGAATGVAVSALTAVLAADRRTRARVARASKQGRQWAQETGERWSAGAALARDRVAGTTEELRDRVVESADQWRERRTEEVGRRLLSAASARDASLEDDGLDDDAVDDGLDEAGLDEAGLDEAGLDEAGLDEAGLGTAGPAPADAGPER